MTDPTEDEVLAHQAVVTSAAFRASCALTEARILDDLVALYRNAEKNGNLHTERAWALIGTISELRRIATNARSDANAAAGIARAGRSGGRFP